MKFPHKDDNLGILQIVLAPPRLELFAQRLRSQPHHLDTPQELHPSRAVILRTNGLLELRHVEDLDVHHVFRTQHIIGTENATTAYRRSRGQIIFGGCGLGIL